MHPTTDANKLMAGEKDRRSRSRVRVVIGGTAGLLFALWSYLVLQRQTVHGFDVLCAEEFRDSLLPGSFRWEVVVFLTHLAGVPSMVLFTVMGFLFERQGARWRLAWAWIWIASLGGLANSTLKATFDRPRPHPEWRDVAVLEANHSYPSGHTMGSVIGFGLLSWSLARHGRGRAAKVFAWALMLVPPLVAFSRVALRAHWFSDVIAGGLVGVAILNLSLAIVIAFPPHQSEGASPGFSS